MTSPCKFAWAVAAIALLFAKLLFDLTQFAFNSTTFSHIALIPFIAAYLASLRWKRAIAQSSPSLRGATLPLALGVLVLGVALLFARSTEVRLCLWTTGFVLLIVAAAMRFLGW